jgi:hypothetical protein
MLVRTLLLTISLCAALAVAGVSAAPAKDGFKLSFTADPIPPITQVPLPFTCHVTIEGSIAYLECHNAAPNPNPPKHKLTVKIDCGGGPAKVTGYPDGQVTASCRGKVSAFDK